MTVTADSTNSGLVNLDSATLAIGSGATFFNFGQIVVANDDDLAGLAGDGVLDNVGDIYERFGSSIDLNVHVHNEAGGRIYTPSRPPG